jgi:hypothetical protein
MGSNTEPHCKNERNFLGPNWRTKLAIELATSGRRARPGQQDHLVGRAAEYHRLRGAADRRLEAFEAKSCSIAEAEAAWNDPAIRGDLQLLVLANCDQDEIATRLGLRIEVVQMIEDLRFDVRPMLDSVFWIVSMVIGRAGDDRDPGFVSRMKLSYFGGRHAVRAILDANESVPLEPAEQASLATVALFVKLQEVLALPVTPHSAPNVLKSLAEIRLGEQQIALEREKLSARMQRWAERRDIAWARIELERSRPPKKDDTAAPNLAGGPAESSDVQSTPATTVAA